MLLIGYTSRRQSTKSSVSVTIPHLPAVDPQSTSGFASAAGLIMQQLGT